MVNSPLCHSSYPLTTPSPTSPTSPTLPHRHSAYWIRTYILRLLCNTPPSFVRMMESVFRDMNWKRIVCYLDNIIVFSDTFEEHLARLEKVFKRLQEHNLCLKSLQLLKKVVVLEVGLMLCVTYFLFNNINTYFVLRDEFIWQKETIFCRGSQYLFGI